MVVFGSAISGHHKCKNENLELRGLTKDEKGKKIYDFGKRR
jgi:hypothetical protein